MHLNAPGTSAVLPLLVVAQLIDVFQLVVETLHSRNRTDSDSEFEQLVQVVVASNSNTKPRQDFGVVSLSSR